MFLRSLAAWFGTPASKQRGMPMPLAHDQRRNPPFSPFPVNGLPHYGITPHFDRGAAKFSFQSHAMQLSTDPIGGNRYVPFPSRPFTYATGKNVTGIGVRFMPLVQYPTTTFPPLAGRLGPLWTPGQLAALMGRYDLAAKLSPAQVAATKLEQF